MDTLCCTCAARLPERAKRDLLESSGQFGKAARTRGALPRPELIAEQVSPAGAATASPGGFQALCLPCNVSKGTSPRCWLDDGEEMS